MAVQKGTEVIVALGPSSYVTIGGDQNAEVRFADEQGEFTHKGSSGLWRELLDGGTVRAVEISLELVDIDDASVQTMVNAIFGASTRHQDIRATLPGLGTVTGNWQISEFRQGGRLNEAASVSFTMMSAGVITYAAT